MPGKITGMGENNMEKRAVLELKNIGKSFPGVKALDQVDLTLREGSVLALVGENGAGKSTLIKIITGVYRPEEGEMYVDGKKVVYHKPQDAFDGGISVVHQERSLCDTFSVMENMFLQAMTTKALSRINYKKYRELARRYLDIVGLDISPDASVSRLKSGQRQMLEIARALAMEARIIMLDEPTASISMKEARILLDTVRKLRDQGYSFLFVSHKMEEVMDIADDITVIRDGRHICDFHLEQDTDRDILRKQIVKAMVGREEKTETFPTRDQSEHLVVLSAENAVSKSNPIPKSFSLYQGEICGWYGLVGAGRTEFAAELIGVDPLTSGTLKIKGEKVRIRDPKEAIQTYRIAYVSENRNEEGVFLASPITVNVSASVLKKISRHGWIDQKAEQETAGEFVEKLSIKTPSLSQLVMNLSGGNRQKVSVAKALAAEPQIVIFDEPCVGIDIKTKEEMYEIIYQLTEAGISVILISSDMKEMIGIADRILVFADSRICDELINTKEYSEMSGKIMNAILANSAGKERENLTI